MTLHQRQWLRIAGTAFGCAFVLCLALPTLSGPSPTPRGAGSPAPGQTTEATPAPELPPPGSTTFVRQLPPDARVPSHSLRVFGQKGEVSIEGDLNLRFSGRGTVWVDKTSAVDTDTVTTPAVREESEFYRLDDFVGTVAIKGKTVRVKAQGEALMAIGNGKGKVTMAGESGIFRLTQAGRKEISGIWTAAGTTQEFETLQGAGGPPMLLGKAGIIPQAPPEDARQYVPKPLPSQQDSAATGALAPHPPASTPLRIPPRATPTPVMTPAPAPTPTTGTAPAASPIATPTPAPGTPPGQ